MKSQDKIIQRRGLHVMFIMPSLLALMLLGLGGVIYQLASSMADDHPPLSTARLALENLGIYSLIISIIMALFGALLGLILSRALVISMRDVVQSARSSLIGAPPPYTQARKSEGFVEVNQLGQSFNQMMNDIYLSFRHRDSALLQGSAFGLVTTDMQGHIMAANAKVEEYVGINSHDLIGQTFNLLAKDNSELDSIARVVGDINERQKLSAETNAELTDREGRKRRYLISASMIRDHINRSSGCVVMLRPSQRYGERDMRMREIDRLAMLGTFTVGLVHEIRNPIAAMKGLSKLLCQLPPDSPKAREFANEIQREASRLERLLGELHHLANKSPEALRVPCNINELLSTSLSTVRHSLNKPDIHVDEQFTPDLPAVMGFTDRLIQAFCNLIRNAFEASPPGGQVTIKTRRLLSTDSATDLVQILITNTGSEISESDRGKIFEPFFTTKQGGTGLGLPIATQAVIQHEGSIKLHGDDRFTTFEIMLPAVSDIALDSKAGPVQEDTMKTAN